jgi:enamine deaminase RidA (YjgF/YER057c/UK114 family)
MEGLMRGWLALALFMVGAPAVAATPEERLAAAGLALPRADPPVATFAQTVRTGNLLFVAGHAHCGTEVVKGKLGREFTVEQGNAYARRVGLCLLASIKADIGELSRVKRFVRIMGMVNATPEFTEHPKVMNGFSDLMVLAFGKDGLAARSSMGLSSLPFGAPVEVEAIVELRN